MSLPDIDAATADTLAEVAAVLLEHGETERGLVVLDALHDLVPGHAALSGLLLDAACRVREPGLAPPVQPATPFSARERLMRVILLVVDGRLAEAGQLLGMSRAPRPVQPSHSAGGRS
jgi:hypothetical protein